MNTLRLAVSVLVSVSPAFAAPLPASVVLDELRGLSAIPVHAPALPRAQAEPWGDAVIVRELTNEGVVGLIHGAVADARQFVLAVHNPNDFFDYRLFPLRLDRQQFEEIQKLKLERHDLVRVKGALAGDPPHVRVTSVTLERRDPTDFSNQTLEIRRPIDPAEFAQPKKIFGLVHGVLREGRQVVLEYQDGILPLTLDEADDAHAAAALDKLWRGDIVEVTVGLRRRPGAPPHFYFDAKAGVRVLDSVRAMQNKPFTAEGPLVLFPRSPITSLDVYAVRVHYPQWGVTRNFTVANFSDHDVWQAGNAKLSAAWTASRATAQQGRNKFINLKLIVRVSGTLAELAGNSRLAQNQANQNIQYPSAGNIVIVSRP
ncbi:MAG: hypothetical protein HY078_09225 [Elusimicrobia bacterium]|nr:hypothetical protein [Elusimicrobiota bacterium]